MSTLSTNTVKSLDANPPAFKNVSGVEIGTLCRAWVNFNGTGTVAIRASFNVSSITDNGTGDYTVNFTNAMPDTSYALAGSGQVDQAGGIAYSLIGLQRSATAKQTTSVRVGSASVTPAALDYTDIDVSIFR
jgi:hypothetical protein